VLLTVCFCTGWAGVSTPLLSVHTIEAEGLFSLFFSSSAFVFKTCHREDLLLPMSLIPLVRNRMLPKRRDTDGDLEHLSILLRKYRKALGEVLRVLVLTLRSRTRLRGRTSSS